jgi:hypothetical protein
MAQTISFQLHPFVTMAARDFIRNLNTGTSVNRIEKDSWDSAKFSLMHIVKKTTWASAVHPRRDHVLVFKVRRQKLQLLNYPVKKSSMLV